jgi:beta-glucanase (GH16 family)
MFSKAILKLKFFSVLSILLLAALTSCGKGGDTPTPVVTAPTNLTLDATVSGTTGNVVFKATATNAVMYTFDLGNGISNQVSVTGDLTYKYSTSGVYTVTVVAKSASGATATKTTVVNVTASLALVWSDEFDATSPSAPDPNKWGYDLGAGGWGNNEQEYYTNRTTNAIVSGGTLKITALKEAYSGSSYTSARLLSKGKFSFKYGKVDISAKLPAGGGTWPALWMLGDNFLSAGWPACGEIDIMEHIGNSLNKIYGTLHYPGRSGGNADGATTMISNATTAFHKYTLEWTDVSIKIYVDDLLYYTFANNATTPFNQNFFFILNVAMGGNFGGTIDPAFTSGVMEVDYVRVYQ